jgi:hypothetical protein
MGPPRVSPAAADVDGRPALVHDEHVWNLALGSNMDVDKLRSRNNKARRPISPLLPGVPATVAGWALAFDLVAMPPTEPAMAAAVRDPAGMLHGILYKLCREDYCTLSMSEGCCTRDGVSIPHTPYKEVVVEVIPYPTHELAQAGTIPAKVLATVFALRDPPPVPLVTRHLYPSRRYVNLLVKGAKEAKLDDAYIEQIERYPVARPVSGPMRGLTRFFAIAYFAMPSRKWLSNIRFLFKGGIRESYARRELAHLAGLHSWEWFWHFALILCLTPLAIVGFFRALTSGRHVMRIARGVPE